MGETEHQSSVGPQRSAGLLLPTLAATAALAVLLGLGTWQLQRKAWKDALQAQIVARSMAPAASVGEIVSSAAAGGDIAYRRLGVRGRFRHDLERHLFTSGSSGPGWHIYTPLVLEADGRALLVNRGFVADRYKNAASRLESRPGGGRDVVEVVGLVRLSEPTNWFTPANNVEQNVWLWRDIEGMARSLRSVDRDVTVLPFSIDALVAPATAGGDPARPLGGTTRLELPSRHLEYALTWFGIALTLIGVYSAFVLSRLRARKQGH